MFLEVLDSFLHSVSVQPSPSGHCASLDELRELLGKEINVYCSFVSLWTLSKHEMNKEAIAL
jgi:hypothetical protein